MATNVKYAAASKLYDLARLTLEQVEERCRREVSEAKRAERDAYTAMVIVRDTLENWI